MFSSTSTVRVATITLLHIHHGAARLNTGIDPMYLQVRVLGYLLNATDSDITAVDSGPDYSHAVQSNPLTSMILPALTVMQHS